MGRRSAIYLSGLLLWIGPAPAEEIKIHPLTVSIQETVRRVIEAKCRRFLDLDIEGCIKKVLKDASDKLQQGSDEQPGCKVGFRLKGQITTFKYPGPDITNAQRLEAAHHVRADIKIVRSVTYCVGEQHPAGYYGCSWRPKGRKTVIVIGPLSGAPDDVLWAHEFGHTTGLLHRYDERNQNLMTPCDLSGATKEVNTDECRHLIAGPVKHPPQGGDECPVDSAPPQNH